MRIVVLSDGTGNSAAVLAKSNVWRVYQALDLSAPDQIAMYDDGVGTSSFRPWAYISGAFGWGLKRNVLQLYMFLCRNYKPGDDIYGFGFSRGAFTIRVLIGLVASQGLVPLRSEAQLRRRAHEAYRAYRAERYAEGVGTAQLWRCLRDAVFGLIDQLRSRKPYDKTQNTTVEHIKFLGLWDTVGAYGMPIEELKGAVDRWIWPLNFRNLDLWAKVDRACHALSIDDERTTFHPVLWNEASERARAESGEVKAGRVSQVWFAGVHSNVGGGYPDDGLSSVALNWIVDEADRQGLRFTPAVRTVLRESSSPYGRLYDSRKQAAGYYRLDPRAIFMGDGIAPVIHESVIQRMAQGSDSYAPAVLPHDFAVSTAGGVLPDLDAYHRTKSADDPARLVEKAQPEALKLVHDVVWWRRVTYFATVLVTLFLVSFPWLLDYRKLTRSAGTDGLARNYLDAEEGLSGFVGGFFDIVDKVVPSFLAPWVEAFRALPLGFMAAAGLLGFLWYQGNVLKGRVRDYSRAAWRPDYAATRRTFNTEDNRKRHDAMFAVVGLGGFQGAAFGTATERALQQFWDSLPSGLVIGAGVLAAGIAVVLVRGVWTMRKIEIPDTVPLGLSRFPLKLARAIRTDDVVVRWYDRFATRYVPNALAIGLLVAALFLVNRVIYTFNESVMRVCQESPTARPATPMKEGESRPVAFDTGAPCYATGILVEDGATYRLDFVEAEGWIDGKNPGRPVPEGAAGFESPLWPPHFLFAAPMRRHWLENWFTPIARVGALGMDEVALAPQSTRIEARRTGELFLFVNDAVLVSPRFWIEFYSNNQGKAHMVVRKIADPPRF